MALERHLDYKCKEHNIIWLKQLKTKINDKYKQKIIKKLFSLYEGRNVGYSLPSASIIIYYNKRKERALRWDSNALKEINFTPLLDVSLPKYDASYRSFVDHPHQTYLSWKNNESMDSSINNVFKGVGNNILNYLPEYNNLDYVIVIIQWAKKMGLGEYRIPKLIWMFFNIKAMKGVHDIHMIKNIKERLYNTKFIPRQLKNYSYLCREIQFQWSINTNIYVHLQQHIALNYNNEWKQGLSWSRWGYGAELGCNDCNIYNKTYNKYKNNKYISIPILYWFHYDQLIKIRNIIHKLHMEEDCILLDDKE